MSKTGSQRTPSARWVRGISEASSPIFLLDDHCRLVLFNRGCELATGWTSGDVLGQICDYVSEPDVHSLAAMLAACAPPAEIWQGQAADMPCRIPHRSEPARSGRIRFQPLLDADRKVHLVWGQFFTEVESSAESPATPAQLLHAELAALRQRIRERYQESSLVTQSLPMRRILAQMTQALLGNGCILLIGESGSGREHLARVLHHRGAASDMAFVALDCRRIEASELKRLIKQLRDDHRELEILRSGTVFFRDIAAAPRDVQERLAEWLLSRDSAASPRIMASADMPLAPLVEDDRFHRELYYELTTTVMELPPLRHRPEDIALLAQQFFEDRNRQAARQLSGFQPETLDHLRRYRWPGNIGELQAVISAAVDETQGPQIQVADLPLSFRVGEDAQRLGPPASRELLPLEQVLAQTERDHITAVLTACRKNLSKTAELLGMSRPKLYRRLEALGLLPESAEKPEES